MRGAGKSGRLTDRLRQARSSPAKHHDFYSYEAKYIDADGALVKAPADVPAETAARARDMAAAAFLRALGCSGMARVDFS